MTNWLVALHQDRSIPVDDATPETTPGWSMKEEMTFIQPPDTVMSQMLVLRLHIDESNTTNGPLRVLPKTHCDGALTPQQIDDYRSKLTAITLTVPRGGGIAMRPLLLHASSKSQTSRSRRVLQFLFGPRSLPDFLKWGLTI